MRNMVILALTLILLAAGSGHPISADEIWEATMTNQNGTPTSRQAAVSRNIDRLFAPGVQADRTGRFSESIGVVKPGTRRIEATFYVADVEVQTRFNTPITIPDVRFNVPVSEGDVVTLNIMGGDPRNGTFGTPLRPKGPTTIDFDGPLFPSDWAADESAPEIFRTTNATYQSYVIPFADEPMVTSPIPSTFPNTRLFTLPDELLIQTLPAVAHVQVSATLHGGLRIAGGNRAGDYAIRVPSTQLYVGASNTDLNDPSIFSNAYTHQGLESARGDGPAVGNYPDKLNNPLKANGERLLFNRLITRHPITVGTNFELAVFTTIPSLADVEFYREITHPVHPVRALIPSVGGGIHTQTPVIPEHPLHEEYSFWTWDAVLPPPAGETYSIWLGLSDVKVDIVVLGTGGG